MKARTASGGLAFENSVCAFRRPRGGNDGGKVRRPILTYSYRLSKVKALGQAESERAVPPSWLDCRRLSVIPEEEV